MEITGLCDREHTALLTKRVKKVESNTVARCAQHQQPQRRAQRDRNHNNLNRMTQTVAKPTK
jgi:hypothetical protein